MEINECLVEVLLSSTINDQDIQNRNTHFLSEIEKLPEYPLQLLSIIFCKEVDDEAKCVAAHLLRHKIDQIYFGVRKNFINMCKEGFNDNFYNYINSIYNLQVSISSLIVKISNSLDANLFPNFGEEIEKLLSDKSTVFLGLSLLKELCLSGIYIEGNFFQKFDEFLLCSDENIVSLSYIVLDLYSEKYPQIVEGIVLPFITNPLQFSASIEIFKFISPVVNILRSDQCVKSEVFIEFILYSIRNFESSFSILAASVFIDNEYIAPNEQIIQTLFQKLGADELEPNNISMQCLKSLKYYLKKEEYRESLITLYLQLIYNNIKGDFEYVRASIRLLSIVCKYMKEFDPLSEVISSLYSLLVDCQVNYDLEIEILHSLSKVSKYENGLLKNNMVDILFRRLSHPNSFVRFQALRSLCDVCSDIVFTSEMQELFLVQMRNNLNSDESILTFEVLTSIIENANKVDYGEKMVEIIKITTLAFFQANEYEVIVSDVLVFFETIIGLFGEDAFNSLFNDDMNNKLLSFVMRDDDHTCSKSLNLYNTILVTLPDSIIQTSLFYETYSNISKRVCVLFSCTSMPDSKLSAWAIFDSFKNSFKDDLYVSMADCAINSGCNEDEENENVIGNVAYSLFHLFLNIQPDPNICEKYFLYCCKKLSIVHDETNLINCVCFIALCFVNYSQYTEEEDNLIDESTPLSKIQETCRHILELDVDEKLKIVCNEFMQITGTIKTML